MNITWSGKLLVSSYRSDAFDNCKFGVVCVIQQSSGQKACDWTERIDKKANTSDKVRCGCKIHFLPMAENRTEGLHRHKSCFRLPSIRRQPKVERLGPFKRVIRRSPYVTAELFRCKVFARY